MVSFINWPNGKTKWLPLPNQFKNAIMNVFNNKWLFLKGVACSDESTGNSHQTPSNNPLTSTIWHTVQLIDWNSVPDVHGEAFSSEGARYFPQKLLETKTRDKSKAGEKFDSKWILMLVSICWVSKQANVCKHIRNINLKVKVFQFSQFCKFLQF